MEKHSKAVKLNNMTLKSVQVHSFQDFEEQLVGMKQGEEKDVEVNIP